MNRIDRIDGNGGLRREMNRRLVAQEFGATEPGIGDLFRQVTDDVALLARQEFQLVKAELRESAEEAKQAAVKFAIAAVLALPGAMALTAFLVIVLAAVLGSWWAATLVVGVVFLAVTGLLVRQGIARLTKPGVGLRESAESLSEGAEWAKEEMKVFKRELTA